MKNAKSRHTQVAGLLLTFLSFVFFATAVQARDVTFTWTANADSVDGYRLYYKTGPAGGSPYDGSGATEGSAPVDTGNVTSFTLHGLSDSETYHFALTAFIDTRESDYSSEITLPPLSTGMTANFSWSVPEETDPLNVHFDASSSSGPITRYQWNFNDGSTPGDSSTTSHTFPAAGTYEVKLTIYDESGAAVSTNKEIVLSPSAEENKPPTASLVITSAAPAGTAPLRINFDAGASSDPENSTLSYSWNFGDGATATGSPMVTHQYTSAGIYRAVVTVTDSQGLADSMTSQPIMVTTGADEGTPTPVITANRTSGSAPMTVVLNGTASTSAEKEGTITTYNWNFADGSTGSGEEVHHTFSLPGEYAVQLTIVDSSGNQAMVSQTITVYAADDKKITPSLVKIYKMLLLNPVTSQTIKAAILSGADDAEEAVDNGEIDLTSSTDLEMAMERQEQIVGLRFNHVAIPKDALIIRAWIQFTADEDNTVPTSLIIKGEATGNAEKFTSSAYNISARNRTVSAVDWTPPPWPTPGANGPDQQTSDLKNIIQEIVNRTDWSSNHSMAFIISGEGKRVAKSYDGVPASAAVLHVEFSK